MTIASLNVKINLAGLKDKLFAKDLLNKRDKIERLAIIEASEVKEIVNGQITNGQS